VAAAGRSSQSALHDKAERFAGGAIGEQESELSTQLARGFDERKYKLFAILFLFLLSNKCRLQFFLFNHPAGYEFYILTGKSMVPKKPLTAQTQQNTGYVYALINTAMPGLVKVGRTQRNPQERAQELSGATGVATPFILLYYVYLSDCQMGERIAHERLSSSGRRENDGREFFRIDNKAVVNLLISLPGQLAGDGDGSENSFIECKNIEDFSFDEHIALIRKEALNLQYGINGFPYEPDLAIEKFQQIVNFGDMLALTDIAECHSQIADDRLENISRPKKYKPYFKDTKQAALLAVKYDESANSILAKVAYYERNIKSFQVYKSLFYYSLIEDYEVYCNYIEDLSDALHRMQKKSKLCAEDIFSIVLQEYSLTAEVEPHSIYEYFKTEVLEELSTSAYEIAKKIKLAIYQ
jgi:hypothetical protein